MKNGLYGVINIGASAFRMIIVEFKKGEPKELEYLIKPLRLGVDTFSQGYISLEHVKQATDILSGFRRKLDEYRVEEYRAVCTSGVREASNKDFFIDYIRIHADIALEVLEPSEEVYIKYVAARFDVPSFGLMEEQGVVFANIASGNVTLSISKGNRVLYSGTLPYGSLRLRQMFHSVPSVKRYKAFDQYADNMIKTVAGAINPPEKVAYLVGGGSSINLMERLFKPVGSTISRDEIEKLYVRIRSYSDDELKSELGLREDEAAVIVPTLITYIHLMNYTASNHFYFSGYDFPMILAMFYSGNLRDTNFATRTRSTFIRVAERYRCNIPHVKKVSRFAARLYHSLKDLHSLGKNEFKILEAAALLHEVGYFIDAEGSAQNSYFIIKSLTIPGWKSKSLFLVACTVYQMIKKNSDRDITHLHEISVKEILLINKLASILRTANALDGGKSDIITSFDVEVNDNAIFINTRTQKEPFVEIASFEHQKRMFVETFGIPIDIKAQVTYE